MIMAKKAEPCTIKLMATITGARGPVIGGLAVGFIVGNFVGSTIDHQLFFGIWSFTFGLVGAGVGTWAGVKISQSM